MLSIFIEFCELYQYEFDFDFNIEEFYNSLPEDELDAYLEDLFKDSNKKPRYFQRDAILAAITEKRGLLLSATGCLDPKSKITCEISRENLEYLENNFR